MNDTIVVLTNLPDRVSAEALANFAVGARHAACANILAPCHSVYRWKGEVEHTEETPVLFKTTRARYAELEQTIRKHHPYEIPEIIVLPVERGFAGYLDWIRQEVA